MTATDLTLTTSRLTIRPWHAGDAEHLFDILRRPEVTEWLGDPVALLEQRAAHKTFEHATDHPPE